MAVFTYFYYFTLGFFCITVGMRLIILWRRRWRVQRELREHQRNQLSVAIPAPSSMPLASTTQSADVVAVIIDDPSDRNYFSTRRGRQSYGHSLPPVATATTVAPRNDPNVVTVTAAYAA
jgi:hypothetical protein